MIKLFEQDIKTLNRQSSKGNQLKWESKSIWYKVDYTGYEGLSEYIISRLLDLSSLSKQEFVSYEAEEISYKYRGMLGCRSHNFFPKDWNIITLGRLFQNYFGLGLHQALYKIQGLEA